MNSPSTSTLSVLSPLCFFLLLLLILPTLSLSSCRTSCGPVPVRYPFGLDDGCGAPQFRGMLNCSTDLFFLTPSGNYKVQSVNYDKKTLVIYDPSMSTCSILQPHHDFVLSDVQAAIIRPTYDTVFTLLNCSVDSPVLHHYKNLCFNFSGHGCTELYDSCSAFRVFRLFSNSSFLSPSPATSPSPGPPCCFTNYDTVRFMSMNILDCSHYTTVVDDGEKLRGVGPLDWTYGIELAFGLPEIGCELCQKSGGTCGFDTETQGVMCLCSDSTNSTRECGNAVGEGEAHTPLTFNHALLWFLAGIVYMCMIFF